MKCINDPKGPYFDPVGPKRWPPVSWPFQERSLTIAFSKKSSFPVVDSTSWRVRWRDSSREWCYFAGDSGSKRSGEAAPDPFLKSVVVFSGKDSI